jgi:hypothetical protein
VTLHSQSSEKSETLARQVAAVLSPKKIRVDCDGIIFYDTRDLSKVNASLTGLPTKFLVD